MKKPDFNMLTYGTKVSSSGSVSLSGSVEKSVIRSLRFVFPLISAACTNLYCRTSQIISTGLSLYAASHSPRESVPEVHHRPESLSCTLLRVPALRR